MSNYKSGHRAEEVAAEYLKRQNFKIIELNWKTRFCEIDIVAQKQNVAYFVEVKYRLTAKQGSGLDYITDKKLRQMRFAAESWVTGNSWEHDFRLGAIELSGEDFHVDCFVYDWM